MSHVTYACNCLNVKIHIANKYYLDGHDMYRKEKFKQLTEPPISGWQFDLGMNGVTLEYKNLVRMRRIMNNEEGWVTVSCHNCKTGDVYSVKRPNLKIEYPINTSVLSQYGDQVIVHTGTIYGAEIENLKKKSSFSQTFHIVLNPDLSASHEPLDKEDTTYGPELNHQYKELKKMLKESLIQLEEATEKRIQAYQAEQEQLLTRDKEKVIYDGAILWQTMKEISKSVQEDEQRARRLSLRQPSHTLFPPIIHQKPSPKDLEENLVEKRRRSSAIKRDLFGGQIPLNQNYRRSSYVLDESAIANCFKNSFQQPQLDSVQEAPAVIQQENVHPLAVHPTDSVVPEHSENNDDSDDMFALDEDMADFHDDLIESKNRKQSTKYIESDNEEEEDTESIDAENNKDTIEPNFSTSVPININFSPVVKNETNQQRHPSISFIDATYLKKSDTRRPSFVGFDYAEADRRQSLKFSPLKDNTRKSSTSSNKLEDGPMIPPHLLAANTATDETEAIFGSIPRNSVRHRPLE